mmetsp:Transcript_2657/g.4128  ORF Transcript_2657/g.4128 Transcript_2657/m.4128 type:complete len:116 (+) Transcript_2657:64-411(+)
MWAKQRKMNGFLIGQIIGPFIQTFLHRNFSFILGAFSYLGGEFTFDDIEESTAIRKEVHRVFFHEFIKIGSTVFYNRYVCSPQNEESLLQHMPEYIAAGFPGAFRSTNATCIVHH